MKVDKIKCSECGSRFKPQFENQTRCNSRFCSNTGSSDISSIYENLNNSNVVDYIKGNQI